MIYRCKIKIHLNCTLKDTSAWEMCDAGASWCGGIRVDVAGRVGSTVCVCVAEPEASELHDAKVPWAGMCSGYPHCSCSTSGSVVHGEVLQVSHSSGCDGWAIPRKLNIRSTLFMVSVDPSVGCALDSLLC